MRLKVSQKTVNTRPIECLLRQGEKNADCIEIESDRLHDGLDLSLLHWVVYGVTSSGNMISQSLKQEITDTKIILLWLVSEDFTAEKGLLRLQFSGVNSEGNTVIKWKASSPLNVLPDLIGGLQNPPETDILEQTLAEMQAMLAKVEEIIAEAGKVAVNSVNEILPQDGNITLTAQNISTLEGYTIEKALSEKVAKLEGKGLSSNDYSDKEKAKLQALSSGSGGVALENKSTTFLINGSILESGETAETLTEFLENGNILETKKDKISGETLGIKTIYFLPNGSINEVIE